MKTKPHKQASDQQEALRKLDVTCDAIFAGREVIEKLLIDEKQSKTAIECHAALCKAIFELCNLTASIENKIKKTRKKKNNEKDFPFHWLEKYEGRPKYRIDIQTSDEEEKVHVCSGLSLTGALAWTDEWFGMTDRTLEIRRDQS